MRLDSAQCQRILTFILLNLIAFAFTSAPLLGQGNNVRKQRSTLEVEEREKPGEAVKKADGPRLNRSAVFLIQVEGRIREGIGKTVRALERQAARSDRGSQTRLKLLEQVLNLNLERSSYIRNDEERKYDAKWKKWDAAGRKGREPQLNTRKSNASWAKVVENAQIILEEFPRSKNADQTTFKQAMALQFLDRQKEAAKKFSKLIRDYRNSPTAGEAYAQLGDYFFQNNDFSNAMNNYRSALKYRNSKRYLWSLFKLGWCNFNLNRYRDALKYWKDVVRYARYRRNDNQGSLQLKDEALRDLVFAFAELKQVDQAIAYYRANGGQKYISSLLMLLANTLIEQGKFNEAMRTLRKFQRIEPFHPDAPESQKQLIDLAYNLNQMNVVWRELQTFAPRYGLKSSWAKKNSAKDRKLVLETQQMIREQFIYYSKLTHKTAIKQNSIRLHREAKKGYLLFLQNYPKARESAEVKFNLADIEYFLKNYRGAGRYYLGIVKGGKKRAIIFAPNGKPAENIHKKSALYMIDAYAKDFEDDYKFLQKQKPNFKKGKERKLSLQARNYIRACDLFRKNYPKDKKTGKVCDLAQAKIFYYSNNKERSKELLMLIAKKYSNTKEGPQAVEELVGVYQSEGNDKKLISVAGELMKIPAYRKGPLGKRLRGLRRTIEIQNIDKEKDQYVRAKKFEQQARKNPKASQVERLWYNAAVNYIEAGAIREGTRAYGVLIKNFPKFEKVPDAILDLAKLYETRLDFRVSADYYALFAKRFPKRKEKAGAALKSCELSLAIDASRAVGRCLSLANKNPKGSQQIYESLIVKMDRDRDTKRLKQLVRTYVSRVNPPVNAKIIAWKRVLRASAKAEAQRARQQILGLYKKNPDAVNGEALRYVSEVPFARAKAKYAVYSRQELKGGSVDALAASKNKVEGALGDVLNELNNVLNTRDPYYGVAALYLKGKALEDYVNKLKNPPGIPGATKAQIVGQFQSFIKDYTKEAVSNLKAALDTMKKQKVYNEWGPKAFNALNRLQGKPYSFDEVTVTPDFVGAQVSETVVRRIK